MRQLRLLPQEVAAFEEGANDGKLHEAWHTIDSLLVIVSAAVGISTAVVARLTPLARYAVLLSSSYIRYRAIVLRALNS